jgi:pyrroloquinoline quinone biosynthesis protein B
LESIKKKESQKSPFIVILGTAQDGGYPQAGCDKICCKGVWNNPALRRLVTSIAIIDPGTKERWLFDITPDFKEQLNILKELSPTPPKNILSGTFITHGHIGHYTGLVDLSYEVMNVKNLDVFVMPMMLKFLEANAPWNQLVKQNNIKLNSLKNKISINLNDRIRITPFLVPHRGELTETVGYSITGPNKASVFIPDIDKWDTNTLKIINTSDIALLDGTFYEVSEIPGRDMDKIPHPNIVESLKLFGPLSKKNKILFIHINHTNPVLKPDSEEHRKVILSGFQIAREKQIIEL